MTSAECFRCGGPATIKFGSGYLCESCVPIGEDDDHEESTAEPKFAAWADVDFSTTTPDTYPEELLEADSKG